MTNAVWKALPTLTIEQRKTGKCPSGHDLNEKTLRNRNGYVRCLVCYHERPDTMPPATCRSGRHPKPAASGRCPACLQEKRERERAKAALVTKDVSYLFVGLPPAEVLAGAACGPETAELFDSLEKGGRPTDNVVGKLPDRVVQALGICAGCPVRLLCREDAMRWRREGVYGGVYFTRRWHWRASAARREGQPLPPLRMLEAVTEEAEAS